MWAHACSTALTMTRRSCPSVATLFELAVSVCFIYTLTSIMLTTFGIYWLGRLYSSQFLHAFSIYTVAYIMQTVSSLIVCFSCLDLIFRKTASLKCHWFWLYFVPLAHLIDHASFFGIGIIALFISQHEDDDPDTIDLEHENIIKNLFSSLGSETLPPKGYHQLATFNERLAVLIIGGILHLIYCLIFIVVWVIVYQHSRNVRKCKTQRRLRHKIYRETQLVRKSKSRSSRNGSSVASPNTQQSGSVKTVI